ncbi:MAG TPA: replication factor C large subunit [Candidatus Nanoarchaeia archaeon]|nr:replication factor C large subunit [Candidatus Nanoarchaeia archaeon]
MLWTEKYKPRKEEEVVGQFMCIAKLRKFLTNFKASGKKAVILHGPTGSGKTCIPYVIASGLNWEVIEANASDFRSKEEVNSKIGSAMLQRSLFSAGKIILVDDIDAFAAEDRGGLQALQKLIEASPCPFVLTASDVSDFKFNSLKRVSEVIDMERIPAEVIANRLNEICSAEHLKCSFENLRRIALRSGNDLRAAINDLQSLYVRGNEVTKDDIELLSERERTETLVNALTKIFKTTDIEVALKSFDYVSEDARELFLWIDENLPKEYEGIDIANAYSKISKADIYNARILNRQYWRFLVYVNALLSAGIATSKEKKYKKAISFSPPGRLLKMYWAGQKSAKKKSIAQKMPSHASVKNLVKDIPYLKAIFRNDREMAALITKELRLEDEEISFLTTPQ